MRKRAFRSLKHLTNVLWYYAKTYGELCPYTLVIEIHHPNEIYVHPIGAPYVVIILNYDGLSTKYLQPPTIINKYHKIWTTNLGSIHVSSFESKTTVILQLYKQSQNPYISIRLHSFSLTNHPNTSPPTVAMTCK